MLSELQNKLSFKFYQLENLLNSILEFFEQQNSGNFNGIVCWSFTWIITAKMELLFFFDLNQQTENLLDMALLFYWWSYDSCKLLVFDCTCNHMQLKFKMNWDNQSPSFLPPAIGFFVGQLAFMFIIWIRSIPHLHIFGKLKEAEGPN